MKVRNEDSLRPTFTQCLLHLFGVERPGVGLDVHQDGMGPDGFDRSEITWEVVGCQEDFVSWADADRAEGEFDGKGSRAAAVGERDLVQLGQRFLQFRDMGAMVIGPGSILDGPPKCFQHLVVCMDG